MFQPSLPPPPPDPNNQHNSFYRKPSRTSGSLAQRSNCPRSTYVAIRHLPTKSVTVIMMLQLRKLSFFNALCCKSLYSSFVTSLYFCDLNPKIQNYVINQHRLLFCDGRKISPPPVYTILHICFHFVLIAKKKNQKPAFACFLHFLFNVFYES